MAELEIRNLHVTAEGKEILKGVSLDVERGSIHALMGPNGSGKSTLANAIMGHPGLEVTEGTITYKGEDITEADPDERSRMGLFMAFQYPVAIPGVTVAKYLRMIVNAHRDAAGEEPVKLKDFRKETEEAMALTNIPKDFSSRYLNDGFSGGEKKRMEILQLAMLQPEMAVLDETDSGLDIDALRVVAEGVNKFAGPGMGVLIITHYQRILHLIKPDAVHVLYDGRIVKEGGPELVEQLEEKGYGWIKGRGRGRSRGLADPIMEPTATRAPSLPRSIEQIRAEFPILAARSTASRSPTSTTAPPRRSRWRDRRARSLLARAQRQRPPRRAHALRGGDRALRGARLTIAVAPRR